MARTMPNKTTHSPALDADWVAISRRLVRFATALTGRRDEAEDLTQQAIATVLARRPEMAGHIGFARRTLVRVWLDRERSVRRRMARITRLAAWGGVPGAETSERDERDEQIRRVRSEIERLPARQRAVVTLRLVEGLTYEQIAEAMECDVGAVRSNLHLARMKLRSVLGDGLGDGR